LSHSLVGRVAIPKFIHQTAPDKSRLSKVYIDNIKLLKQLNPDWTHTLYDDDDMLRFNRDNYDQEMFNRYKKISSAYGAAKADYLARGDLYLGPARPISQGRKGELAEWLKAAVC
jgi:mannosyltransferase OCH1-like enzyme